MAFSSTQGVMVGTILELVVFGAYAMLFVDHIKIMYRRRTTSWSYIYLLSSSIIIFILSLVHVSVDSWRVYTAFAGNLYAVPPISPIQFFSHENTWDSRARTATYDLITLVSDLFFVYRTWIIWNKNYFIIIIPFLLFLGDIVTLALTLICTLLIAYRLWSVDRHVMLLLTNVSSRQRRLSQVSKIIIESAALYSSLLIVMIATDVVGSQVFFILLSAIPPVIGLVFSSIIVRSTRIDSPDMTSKGTASALHFQSRRRNLSESGNTASTPSGGDGLQIHLQTITQSDGLRTRTETEDFAKVKYRSQESV
ncbi:hypothetical protein BDZ89DRAFT_1134174 [Hymenopellis radicata]|nr:hypothetical protein BDZ89DRAFT_1134174 [Hymenopellis radicata]